MLDIGWSEMAVIALVALVVIGPKDLPKAMKAVAYWVTRARKLSSEFHRGIDQIVREAELEEAREAIRSAGQMNLDRAVEQTIDPTGDVERAMLLASDINADAPPPDAASAAPSPEPPAIAAPSTPEPAGPDPATPGPAKAEPA
jgi:sec-independent protein translocase protein TatB